MLEDALNVYVAYSSRLSWSETFKLIRKLLFKMERVQRQAWQYTAEKEDDALEKTVTKSLCKVLEGLSLNTSIALPDSIAIIEEQAKIRELANRDKYKTEFTALLDDLVKLAHQKGENNDDAEMENTDSDDEVQKAEPKQGEEAAAGEIDVI